MIAQSVFASVNAALISSNITFALFAAIVILIWVFALIRQSIGLSVLSMVCWFSFSYALFIVAEANSFIAGFALLAALLGCIMLILTVYQTFRYFGEIAEAKERQRQEEIP